MDSEKILYIDGKILHGIEAGKTHIKQFANMGDGVLTEYNEHDGLTAYIILNNPNEEEKRNISSESQFEISVSVIEGVLFIQYKFGAMPLCDCVFEPRLYQSINFPDLSNENKGLALNIMLVDPQKEGLVEYMRIIGLGHEFSKKLIEQCNILKLSPFNKDYHNRKITRLMNEYDSRDIYDEKKFSWKLNDKGNGNERNPLTRWNR